MNYKKESERLTLENTRLTQELDAERALNAQTMDKVRLNEWRIGAAKHCREALMESPPNFDRAWFQLGWLGACENALGVPKAEQLSMTCARLLAAKRVERDKELGLILEAPPAATDTTKDANEKTPA